MRRYALPRTGCLICLCVAGAACGCGRSATVTGKVTYKDRPVIYGSVIIQNADRTARSCAIQPDGSYTVEDVQPGEVKIAVLSRDPTKGRTHAAKGADKAADKKKGTPPKPPADWFPLPRHYEDPETSGLTCTVGAGRVEHPIELK